MQWIRQLDNSLSCLFGEESYSVSLWPLIHKSVHGTHILVVLPAVVWLPKPMTAKDTMKQEAQRATYRAPEYNVQPFGGIGQSGHLFTDQPEKHKLGRGLALYKFITVGGMGFLYNCNPLSTKHAFNMVVLILGVLPQNNFGLNVVKSCSSRQEKQGVGSNLDKGNIEKGWPFHTEHWIWNYRYMYVLYNTGERS